MSADLTPLAQPVPDDSAPPASPSSLPVSCAASEAAPPRTAAELVPLLRRAEHGDAAALPALRALFERPGLLDRLAGDLARRAEEVLLISLAGDNLVLREAVARKLQRLRAELAGAHPTPLEVLLAERAAACWLQVQEADLRAALATTDDEPAHAEFHQRRQGRAHQRFLQALKALAAVRRLALPVLVAQVNIDRRQVHLGD